MSESKSQPIQVFEYMKKRGVELTREEVVNGTGLSRDQVRKALNTFIRKEVVVVHDDEVGNGIPRYTLHPDADVMKYNNHLAVRIKEGEEAVVTPKRQPLKESDIDRQGEDGKSFLYQHGYSQGYNDAMFHSHRDAYNAGRKVVIEGLLKLLKVDAKVLMS